MRAVIIAAGICNLIWGGWLVLFPAALFHWTGIAAANYPEIWRCVGMIVGVYGIGYLIAASDPIRHWPIVLVGPLGKLLGAVGLFWSVAQGSFAPGMAWTCLTNDLIWWAPFAYILYRGFTHHRASVPDNQQPGGDQENGNQQDKSNVEQQIFSSAARAGPCSPKTTPESFGP